MSSACQVCEAMPAEDDIHCGKCSAALRGPGWVLTLLPATLTGCVIGVLGLASGRVLFFRTGDDFIGSLTGFVLGSTVPYFKWIFGFVTGWVAVVALRSPTGSAVTVIGVMTAVLYPASILAARSAPGGAVSWDGDLGIASALVLIGSALSKGLSIPLGERTGVTSLVARLPGGRLLRIGIGSLLTVAALLLLYAITVFAVVIAVMIALLVFLVWAIFGRRSGGGTRDPGGHHDASPGGWSPPPSPPDSGEKPPRERGRLFDATGASIGWADTDGRRYNAQGHFVGRTAEDGSRFDAEGRYAGRIDEQGTITDERGVARGRIDGAGSIFDERGVRVGWMENDEESAP